MTEIGDSDVDVAGDLLDEVLTRTLSILAEDSAFSRELLARLRTLKAGGRFTRPNELYAAVRESARED